MELITPLNKLVFKNVGAAFPAIIANIITNKNFTKTLAFVTLSLFSSAPLNILAEIKDDANKDDMKNTGTPKPINIIARIAAIILTGIV